MQGTDELLDDMSSPLNNGGVPHPPATGVGKVAALPANSFPGPSGFSGGVSRFLESRSKNFGPIFQPVKNTRFEVAKTNAQISLAMKFGQSAGQGAGAAGDAVEAGGGRKGAFQLSGTGAMFLKSRRSQLELHQHQQLQQQMPSPAENSVSSIAGGSTHSVKGILRDSSLTDMRRRFERDEDMPGGGGGTEDKKSVRFNLDNSSPNEDEDSARKVPPSPELSINSDEDEVAEVEEVPAAGEDEVDGQEGMHDVHDDDDDVDVVDDEDDDDGEDDEDDDDVWDEDIIDPDAMEAMCSLNPFISDAPNAGQKPIRIISVPKAQTIQMLKSQTAAGDAGAVAGGGAAGAGTAGGDAQPVATASSYLDKLKESAAVKPLYEDTDSDSKGSSVRSFIINKSEQESLHGNNPFDLDELGRKHSHELEQLQRKSAQAAQLATDKLGLRSLKMASKLVGLLKQKDTAAGGKGATTGAAGAASSTTSVAGDVLSEAAALQQLQQDMEAIKREHEARLKSLRHEYDLRLTSHQHQLEEAFELQLEEYRTQLEHQLQSKRSQVVAEHKARMATLQSNHAELLHELERDLRSEQEILRREHAAKLTQMRDKLAHELELEKQRLRDNGEERLYEKVRCEKRLLEDKYRCLKEKYVRLKTDVKLSLERRSRRREAQAMQQQQQATHGGAGGGGGTSHHMGHTTNTNTTTGSETERSISQKPSIGNSENRSLSYSEQATAGAGVSLGNGAAAKVKPPVPPKTHLAKPAGIASKYIKQLQLQDDTNTSLSQSDTTISNNYSKGRYLGGAPTPSATPTPSASAVVLSDNGNSDSEALHHQLHAENNNNNAKTATTGSSTLLAPPPPRKKLFSRTKSASTSRLNSDNSNNYKRAEQQQQQQQQLEQRPCTPVENLRHQLQKLEDLEDQFPEHTLDTTYHLRYPFTDIGSAEHAAVVGSVVGSELEFFKHRIHLERDSVRRAKESLRTQRTNFRARQREIKQRHKTNQLSAAAAAAAVAAAASSPRHSSLDQLIQEEKELTEMEVNLHRTRALLGEKVIRLRHLEQSLLRIYEKEKPNLEQEPKDDATTLSDLSSHSSSGFSSTDFASGAGELHGKRKEYFQQESNECIQNLEILNAEIREILDILGQKHQQQAQAAQQAQAVQAVQHHQSTLAALPLSHMPLGHMPHMMSANDLGWSHMLSQQQQQQQQAQQQAHQQVQQAAAAVSSPSPLHAPQSIPTLADRLETYRQLAAGRMHSSMGGAILAANTIVSQSPRAVNYTTSLVERTRDLRNWLRQAKTEHELLTGMGGGLAMHTASGSSIGSIAAAPGAAAGAAAVATNATGASSAVAASAAAGGAATAAAAANGGATAGNL